MSSYLANHLSHKDLCCKLIAIQSCSFEIAFYILQPQQSGLILITSARRLLRKEKNHGKAWEKHLNFASGALKSSQSSPGLRNNTVNSSRVIPTLVSLVLACGSAVQLQCNRKHFPCLMNNSSSLPFQF